jgi:DNA-binding NarL/FixJ family response regulator
VVAVLSSSVDATDILCRRISSLGCRVVSATLRDLRENRVEPGTFMRMHDPAVVVFDLSPPYALNWHLLKRLQAARCRTPRRFVISAINPRHVDEIMRGSDTVYELAGKAADLARITLTVKGLLQARRARAAEPAEPMPVNPAVHPAPFGLTPREVMITRQVAEGVTNREIADRLSISIQTVKHHLTMIFDKTRVSTRLQLALLAIQHGIAARAADAVDQPKAQTG